MIKDYLKGLLLTFKIKTNWYLLVFYKKKENKPQEQESKEQE